MTELSEIKGLGPATLEKLEAAGIGTLMQLAVTPPSDVAMTAGMSESMARKLIKECRKNLSLGVETASEFAKKRAELHKISTGCDDFDEMIGGGFPSGTITEVYGRTASGKSQLSHLMVVRALLGDETNKSIFIDSEGTWTPDRVSNVCEANGINPDDAMERIYVGRSYNHSHQMLLIEEVEKILQKDNTYKLLVIDSLTSHFRADFSGRGELASRQQLLNKHLHQLLKIADIYNLVVIVTNQVQSDPGMMYGNPEKPIGGNILSHSVTSIIYLRPSKAGTWAAKLVDSPALPQNDCFYVITKNGFENINEVKK